jgi:hypothetical protein
MKLNKVALGLSVGIVWGLAIFLITNFRLLTGGEGQTLSKLGAFYFGYTYTHIGSLIGLFWGFVDGFIGGWVVAFFYNLFSKEKS